MLTTPMPYLTFTRSTFGLPDVPRHDEGFNIDLAPYANSLLRSRIQDAFRRKRRWISRRRERRTHGEGDHLRDEDFIDRTGVERAREGLAETHDENVVVKHPRRRQGVRRLNQN